MTIQRVKYIFTKAISPLKKTFHLSETSDLQNDRKTQHEHEDIVSFPSTMASSTWLLY